MNEEQHIYKLLDSVCDPEVPVLSVNDLGIIRNVEVVIPSETVAVTITPTYSGCPAMDAIKTSIRWALLENGYKHVDIKTELAPAWTTEWMTEKGKQKLQAFGIAPPGKKLVSDQVLLFGENAAAQCPQCRSNHTELISEFGSTACKSLYRCLDCLEPFDHFKCH